MLWRLSSGRRRVRPQARPEFPNGGFFLNFLSLALQCPSKKNRSHAPSGPRLRRRSLARRRAPPRRKWPPGVKDAGRAAAPVFQRRRLGARKFIKCARPKGSTGLSQCFLLSKGSTGRPRNSFFERISNFEALPLKHLSGRFFGNSKFLLPKKRNFEFRSTAVWNGLKAG